jgi:hypothetical protein
MTHILLLLAASMPALASSHREAPAISLDPAADLTDFYAFINPSDPTKVVFILNVNPMEPAGGGPNFHRFDDGVIYQIHIDNEGDGREDIRFGFRFTTSYSMPDTFLYNVGDISNPANVNHKQTYVAARWDDGTLTRTLIPPTNQAQVAPANVGVVSNPTGYAPESTLPGSLTTAAIRSITTPGGTYRTFAGPRQEGFYVDLERTFDLLNLAGPDNTNTLLGYNVHSIAIEVPINTLTRDFSAPVAGSGNEIIAAWATTARRRTRIHEADGLGHTDSGSYVQVARLGNPLVNEAVIPVSMKDVFNASPPDQDGQFLSYVTEPLLPIYMEAILGVPNPGPYSVGLGIGGREDLVWAFLTGIPGLTQPAGFSLGAPIPGEPGKSFGAFEALRLNLTQPASSFPNGRAVGDDVVDIALSAMAGLLIDGTFIPDGVDSNGLSYLTTFPYLGDPWSGDDHPQGFHDL